MNERVRYRNGIDDMGGGGRRRRQPQAYNYEPDEYEYEYDVVGRSRGALLTAEDRFLVPRTTYNKGPLVVRPGAGGSAAPAGGRYVRTPPVESRTSLDRQWGLEVETHLTDLPFDMAHEQQEEEDAAAAILITPDRASVGTRMMQQARMSLPQSSGYEYSIKGPRYSSPSPVRIPSSPRNDDGDEDPCDRWDGEEERRRDPLHRRTTAHYTQRGYNQWERVDTTSHARPFEYGVRERREILMDDQDPFHGLEGDPVVEDNDDEDDNDDDDMNSPPPFQIPPKARPRTLVPVTDETSNEDEVVIKRRSPTNLQERSQQAWKSRQRKNSFGKKSVDHRGGVGEREPAMLRSPQKVSFGLENDVQYYDPPVSEVTDQSFDDEKSLNSEYTKTVESEVEDMIKDVLFIGNPNTSRPGRRKYKYKHEVKKRLRDIDEMGTTTNQHEQQHLETLDELDEDVTNSSRSREVKASTPQASHSSESLSREKGVSKQSKNRRQNRTSSKSPRNPNEFDGLSEAEATLWNFVEGGMTVVSTALGLLPGIPSDPTSRGHDGEYQAGDDFCAEPILPFVDCSAGRAVPVGGRKRTGNMSEVVERSQNMVYAQLADNKMSHSKDSRQNYHYYSVTNDSNRESTRALHPRGVDRSSNVSVKNQAASTHRRPLSLERLADDPRFHQLCLYAAKSIHRAQGAEFDEDYHISIAKDIEISVVELILPLGLIFLENEGGCYVTKVDRQGSAARSGGVEVGDQLAAVNGTSSFRMKVEDICDLVTKPQISKSIELMFIRYIGPLIPHPHPCSKGDSVGYDVDMTSAANMEVEFKDSKLAVPEERSRRRGFRMFWRGKKKT